MFRALDNRFGHYLLLAGAMALLTLPNLGAHSLWDIDEGRNAEAAREMLEGGTWVTPTFNFELRSAKPVLLYWCQILSYRAFGVNEFGARFPSAVAATLTVLLLYELGRRMFGARTGLLAGLALASCFEFCILAHAATPDALLLLFTVLTFLLFWVFAAGGGRAWFVPVGAAAGLAVLTKGPV
ncbi:MAG TPA: glycosyltransferase family 39 protein, partial [Gemmataceae bacterium]